MHIDVVVIFYTKQREARLFIIVKIKIKAVAVSMTM